jgi:hypothetical protein
VAADSVQASPFPDGFLPALGPAADPAAPAARTPGTGTAAPPLTITPPATRRYRNRRLAVVLVFLLLTVVVVLMGQVMRENKPVKSATVTPVATRAPEPSAVPPDTVDQAPSKAPAGAFVFAGGPGPVLGSAGSLRRFRVAVEKRLGGVDDFAADVDRILGDARSWIAGRQFRLQRVPSAVAAEFTIYLAAAGTAEKMCATGGLRTAGFTSCRLPGQVIINSERWANAVPGYGAPLAVYRAYAINHEVGHQLGHGHEACGGRGELAPVMMQQTYGLKGCVANAWPYRDGERYAGNPVD